MSTNSSEQISLRAIGSPASELASSEHQVEDGFVEPNPIQSGLVNLSVIASAVKSPSIQSFIAKFGKQFLVPAVKARAETGAPITTTLANSGGLVSWLAKSPKVQEYLGHVDTAIQNELVSPDMVIEVIEHPEYLVELVKSLSK